MPDSPWTSFPAFKNHFQATGRLTFQVFFQSEASSGYLLIASGILAMIFANSGSSFLSSLLQTQILPKFNVQSLVNQGLMTLFFLFIGLEIKKELISGELQNKQKALSPLIAALGGIILPALIFTAFNHGTQYQKAWAIPIATDIALSLGTLSLLGKAVPETNRIFLAALSIADDLGAVLVIGLFYSSGIAFEDLLTFAIILAGFISLRRLQVKSIYPYLLLGLGLWSTFYMAHIEPTLAGIFLAAFLPVSAPGESNLSLSDRVESILNPIVTFGVMPVFVFANAGIALDHQVFGRLIPSLSLGIFIGLVAGKPLGILLANSISNRFFAVRPDGFQPPLGLAILGGIGLTMSLFIAQLALPKGPALETAKISILGASIVSGILGLAFLSKTYRQSN